MENGTGSRPLGEAGSDELIEAQQEVREAAARSVSVLPGDGTVHDLVKKMDLDAADKVLTFI